MSEHPTFAASIMRQVLAPPATLAKLAARGMFASVSLNMPPDIHNADIKILFEGEVTRKSIIEVYAPGDETGWAVAYKPSPEGFHTGDTELIFGKWLLCRGELLPKAREVPTEESAGEPASSVFGLGDALGIELEDEDQPPSQVPVTNDMKIDVGDVGDASNLEEALGISDKVDKTEMIFGDYPVARPAGPECTKDAEAHYAAFGSDGDT